MNSLDPYRELSSSSARQWELAQVVSDLREARRDWRQGAGRQRDLGTRELPSREELSKILSQFKAALFPMRLGPSDLREESEDYFVGHTLDVALNALWEQVRLELQYSGKSAGQLANVADEQAFEIVRTFAARLGFTRRLLDEDIQAAFNGDPAARTVDEVLLCYPGITAIIHHRLAHQLYEAGVPLIARIVSEIAHSETGIDIHPGATIGNAFFIDHGTGVVIGETAIIGERVRIYQNVTLGAKRFDVDDEGHLQKGGARHPVVGNDVVIYAGATVLGRITIGDRSTIGGNVWLTHSVASDSHVTQANSQQQPTNRG